MPLRLRASQQWNDFALPLSYKINETDNTLSDAQNVYTNQGRLETRFGLSRYNTTGLGGSVLSSSFFKDVDGNIYLIAKVGTVIYKVAESGAHTSLKTGLSATTKHRGLTLNNRHIISVEGDGLFQYNGTDFKTLGQIAPESPTLNLGAAGSLPADTYYIQITFYDSSQGFESDASIEVSQVTAGEDLSVDWSGITDPTGNIDKVRVYSGTTSGSVFFVTESAYTDGSYTIAATPAASSQTPPSNHGVPVTGGGAYMTEFNTQLVYAGNNTFKNDVFFSISELPDAYDDETIKRLFISGDGPITGIATGYYNDSLLDPYLVIFKKRNIHIYSEISDNTRQIELDSREGCVAHNTIQVIGGDVYFLSENGWRVISNGNLIKKSGKPIPLGDGKIDDIFKRPGFQYEVNTTNSSNFFSVYYHELGHYITFISEGASTNIKKGYSFEMESFAFRPYVFNQNMTSGCKGEDSAGNEVVYFSDDSGYIYSHSVQEDRNDELETGNNVTIQAKADLQWLSGGDFDATYNFREAIVRALPNKNTVTVKGFINYSFSDETEKDYDFSQDGFTLDLSQLDVDRLADDREPIEARSDINRVGRYLMLRFEQNADNANIGLIGIQIDFSKNGNRNE